MRIQQEDVPISAVTKLPAQDLKVQMRKIHKSLALLEGPFLLLIVINENHNFPKKQGTTLQVGLLLHLLSILLLIFGVFFMLVIVLFLVVFGLFCCVGLFQLNAVFLETYSCEQFFYC